MSLCASVYMCFVVTCWERADLLALICGVYCEFVTFPLVSWVRCGTWLYRFLIFAPLLTLSKTWQPGGVTYWRKEKFNYLPLKLLTFTKVMKTWILYPLPFISQFPSSKWVPIFDQADLSECMDFFRRVRCTKILRIQTLNAFFLRMSTNNAKICVMWPKMCLTYVVYVCSDISLSECYLGSMERWGREASKTELKGMFQLSNDKRYVS